MRTQNLLLAVVMLVFLSLSCTPETEYIDMIHDTNAKAVMSLDYCYFNWAASEMIQSMIQSGTLNKQGGGRYVMATGRIVNDTMQRIDTDQLMAKVEQELMNSGQVAMTSAVGIGSRRPTGERDKKVYDDRSAVDQTVYDVRELRDSEVGDEFDPDMLPAKKQLIAPDLSISGKIFQRNLRYDKNKQQIEYYFQLKVTDLTTGLRFWQKEVVIGKRGSNKSVAW